MHADARDDEIGSQVVCVCVRFPVTTRARSPRDSSLAGAPSAPHIGALLAAFRLGVELSHRASEGVEFAGIPLACRVRARQEDICAVHRRAPVLGATVGRLQRGDRAVVPLGLRQKSCLGRRLSVGARISFVCICEVCVCASWGEAQCEPARGARVEAIDACRASLNPRRLLVHRLTVTGVVQNRPRGDRTPLGQPSIAISGHA